jgi:inosose dehydratase
LHAVDEITAASGLRHVLHPHVGTLVEVGADVDRVLEGSSVAWCLDTGHLAIGGVDPVGFAERVGGRVGHVHLKDVDQAIAARVRSGELSLLAGVRQGLFQPLGSGDLAIADVVHHLQSWKYQGWYVLEQDIAVPSGEIPLVGRGPVGAVRESIEYLRLHVTGQQASA